LPEEKYLFVAREAEVMQEKGDVFPVLFALPLYFRIQRP
jgi:hypothetical protein